jgi:hypothetical protein
MTTKSTTTTFTAVQPAAIKAAPVAPMLAKAAMDQVWTAAHTLGLADMDAAKAKAIAVKALKSAGIATESKQKAIRERFIEDYYGTRLFPAVTTLADSERAEARRVMDKKGAKTAKGDRRTGSEQLIDDAARAAWSRMLKACCAKTVEARGANSNKGSNKPEGGDKPTSEPSRPNTPNDVVVQIQHQANTMLAYVQKHMVTFKGAAPLHALTNLVVDFKSAVNKLVADAPAAETEETGED